MARPDWNSTIPDRAPPLTSITVCYVGEEPADQQPVRTALAGSDAMEVRTVQDPGDGLEAIEAVDCVVSYAAFGSTNGAALYETVRERDRELPFVLVTGERPDEFGPALVSDPWTEVVRRDDDGGPLPALERRVRRLVEHRRLVTLLHRGIAAVETVHDGTAIVGPDGTFEYVNQSFATQFGHSPQTLVGAEWRTVYADDEVDRLEREVLPTIEDGWRWTGSCVGQRSNGTTFTARTGVTGLEDGSLVFVVNESDGRKPDT
ncbi:PAS domain S-box protein [Halosolutus halophilus]|uniref:PAS domain S-box protein n=1 Tax=Halosolutus halophilus TaxID=1552990 RepID=UPI0022352375|nr:PAS domain S-box protein [Halosolutus halophilus]